MRKSEKKNRSASPYSFLDGFLNFYSNNSLTATENPGNTSAPSSVSLVVNTRTLASERYTDTVCDLGSITHTRRVPVSRYSTTLDCTSLAGSLGEMTSTARSGASSQYPVGSPAIGIRASEINETSAPRTMSGLRARIKPLSLQITPSLRYSTNFAKCVPILAETMPCFAPRNGCSINSPFTNS